MRRPFNRSKCSVPQPPQRNHCETHLVVVVTTPMAPPNLIRFVPAVSNFPRDNPGREMACVDPSIAPSAHYRYGTNPNKQQSNR